MKSRVAAIALGLVLWFPWRRCEGQGPQRVDSVSMDLAAALAGYGALTGPTDPELLVGSIPDSIQRRIALPPSARVLATVVTNALAVVFVNVPARDSALADLRLLWVQQGWRAPPDMRAHALVMLPQRSDILRRPMILCGDRDALQATVQQARSDVMTLSIQLGAPPSVNNPCAIRPEVAARSAAEPRVALEPWVMRVACPRMMQVGPVQRSLGVAAAPGELLADVGRQMRDSGWTLLGDEEIQSQRWMRTDSTGAVQEAGVLASRPPTGGDCRHLTVSWGAPSARRTLNTGPKAPVLTLPPSADDIGPQGCRAALSFTRSLEISSSASVTELVDHYGQQLADAGWTKTDEKSIVVGQLWTRAESGGERREITVEVSASSRQRDCLALSLLTRYTRP